MKSKVLSEDNLSEDLIISFQKNFTILNKFRDSYFDCKWLIKNARISDEYLTIGTTVILGPLSEKNLNDSYMRVGYIVGIKKIGYDVPLGETWQSEYTDVHTVYRLMTWNPDKFEPGKEVDEFVYIDIDNIVEHQYPNGRKLYPIGMISDAGKAYEHISEEMGKHYASQEDDVEQNRREQPIIITVGQWEDMTKLLEAMNTKIDSILKNTKPRQVKSAK